MTYAEDKQFTTIDKPNTKRMNLWEENNRKEKTLKKSKGVKYLYCQVSTINMRETKQLSKSKFSISSIPVRCKFDNLYLVIYLLL